MLDAFLGWQPGPWPWVSLEHLSIRRVLQASEASRQYDGLSDRPEDYS